MRKWTRIAAYGLIVQDEKLLLCRLSAKETHVGKWTLPGGGLDFGEHPEAGAIREIWEETGLEARILSQAGIDSKVIEFSDGTMHALRFLYWAEVTGGQLAVEVDGTTDLCAWFDKDEASKLPLVDLAQLAIEMVFGFEVET